MNRATAVTIWREVCGSDTVMAMMPPTGRMLEDFARRISEIEREACKAECVHFSFHFNAGSNERDTLQRFVVRLDMRPNK